MSEGSGLIPCSTGVPRAQVRDGTEMSPCRVMINLILLLLLLVPSMPSDERLPEG